MRKGVLIIAAFAVVVLYGTAAWASSPYHHNKGVSSRGVTADETQKNYTQYMQNTLETRTKLAQQREMLLTLHAQPQPDQAQIQAIQGEIIDLRASLAHQANTYHIGRNHPDRHMGHFSTGRSGFRHHGLAYDGYRYNGACRYPGWK
jgi:hypothetical protein